MVSETIKSKKALVLYKAYKMENGDTMKIDPKVESFYLTEKSAAAALIESRVNLEKEDPLEDVKSMMGDTIHILKVVIYTSRIPQEDWKDQIIQEGDSIRLPLGKYQKSMNIYPLVIENFETVPDRADPKKIEVKKVTFAK